MSRAAMLAEYLHGQARWREMKAEEYPDDDRNMRAANALDAAADEVENLPDDDPRLQKMDHARWFENGLCDPGEHGGEVVRRYGFHRGTTGYLLADLARAAEHEDEELLGQEVDDILRDDLAE